MALIFLSASSQAKAAPHCGHRSSNTSPSCLFQTHQATGLPCGSQHCCYTGLLLCSSSPYRTLRATEQQRPSSLLTSCGVSMLPRSAMAPMGATKPGTKRLVMWFRNDLRLHDNYMVHEAVTAIKQQRYQEALPVYVFDPRFFAPSKWGMPKTGAFRAKFLLESVADLKARLQDVGSDLLVTVGQPEHVIPPLLQGCESPLVLTMTETTSEELRVDTKVQQSLKPLGGRLQRVWGHSLYHLDDLQAESGPYPASRGGVSSMGDVFTPFREKVEKRVEVRKEVPTPCQGSLPLPAAGTSILLPAGAVPSAASASSPAPSKPGSLLEAAARAYEGVPGHAPTSLAASPAGSQASAGSPAARSLQELLQWTPSWEQLPWPAGVPERPSTHKHAVLDFKGGETAALARLKYYLWDTDLVSTYFDTRNGMLGGDYSTKFSAWHAHGCLSPRTVFHAVKKYEAERVANKSTYWVLFELIWRDFFKFFSMKHGNKIFFASGTSAKQLQWNSDPNVWARWRDGHTGLPLVDANMREMAATGFMSNRGRQNVASHLVLDLGVDWRRGADYFESLLLDYDVAVNWGNWVAAAGLTGGRINLFNITKQSKDYDPEGDYIRTWLPELRNVPASRIHEPWLMSKEEQQKYGVQIGVDYPQPIPVSSYGRPHAAPGRGPREQYNDQNHYRAPSSSSAYKAGGRGAGHSSGASRGAGARGRGKKSDFERFG